MLAIAPLTIGNGIETGRDDPSLPLACAISDLFGQPIEATFLREDAARD